MKSKPRPAEPQFLTIRNLPVKVQFVDINLRTASYQYRIWIDGKETCPIWVSEWLEDGVTHVDLQNYDWESKLLKIFPHKFNLS